MFLYNNSPIYSTIYMNDITYDRTNYMDNDHKQDLRKSDMKHF